MRNLKIELYETNELSDEVIGLINDLKNEHWKHTKEEHMKWFKNNIRINDKHLLIWGGHCLLAYLNLVHVNVEIDKRQYRMFGIGNVCVSKNKEHMGIGAILMSVANAFLKEEKTCGLLLCHNNTLRFYECNGWKTLDVETSLVKGNSYVHYVMFYDPNRVLPGKAEQFMADRSF